MLSVILMALSCAWTLSAGCEDEIPPPPPETPAARREPDIDAAHMATFRADREIHFTNAVFVCQPDPSRPGMVAVSLTTSRESADGSRMIFGAFAEGVAAESLKDKSVDILGGSLFDVRGSGVFTAIAAYQPRFTKLKVEKIEGGSVHGVIQGEFYRFRATRLTGKPEPIEGELRFKAKLLDPRGARAP